MGVAPEGWAEEFVLELAKLVPATPAEREGSFAWREREMLLSRLPPGYAEETLPVDAAGDWVRGAPLVAAAGPGATDGASPAGSGPGRRLGPLALAPSRPGCPGDFRLRRAGPGRVELSALLPVLESFGLATVEAVPWHFALGNMGEFFVDDIGLRAEVELSGEAGAEVQSARQGQVGESFARRFVGAVEAVVAGEAEESALNRLVIGGGLTWEEVNLLSAYRGYRYVVGGPRANEHAESMAQALVTFPKVSLAAVRLFRSRLLAPGEPKDAGGEREARAVLSAALTEVPDLSHYEALRELVALVEATTRTNFALALAAPAGSSWPIALKFAAASVPFLPQPRPFAEVYVWSPWFEGLHLRFGPVARGGIRWSERQADMRAEILGLARAQVKKNTLIVPTGAKGGFLLRPGSQHHGQPHNPALPAGAQAQRAERARLAYTAFIGALLDITDNIVSGEARHPEAVRCLDGDDPYLVVAADKGTAAFSDLANAVSAERGYWLGDAFASGGSHGYDHKALGITARGTWAAVRRHFRALGMDADRDPLRVVGVGDMSGDVFGNGMLQGNSIRLIAAFDHRHIFVDPSPDPARSYAERLRISKLPGSCWADYDLSTASAGAAVYSRQAKEIHPSPEACAALGIPEVPLSPPELVKAVLRAPVDLVFFGGVGTFVKGPGETDVEVDDEANDDVRVSADQLRVRVVAEGANLGLTQSARVAYSRRGGRVNTDFVDNAAGVAMSDREVNLKILLDLAISSGRLSASERDKLLVEAQSAAAASVLATVEWGAIALDGAASTSAAELPVWESLMADLQANGLLDPAVEALPLPEEMSRRKQAGAGFSRPELAVLVAYARSALARDIELSPLGKGQDLEGCAKRYFPLTMAERFGDLVPEHPLFSQLISSELANEVITRMGAVWADEVAGELGCHLYEAAGAYWAAAHVLPVGFGDEVDKAARSLPAETEATLRASFAKSVDRLGRWYLLHDDCSRPGALIERDKFFVEELERFVAAQPAPPAQGDLEAANPLATTAAVLSQLAAVGELAWVARATGNPLSAVAEAHHVVASQLSLPSLLAKLQPSADASRWERWHLHRLADDLAQVAADVSVRALAEPPSVSAPEAVERWLAARPAALGRARELAKSALGTPASEGARPAIALASVSVRALREVVAK